MALVSFFFLNNDKFRIKKLFFKHTLWRFYTACFIVIFFFISLLLFCSLYRSALDISRGHGEDQNCLRWFVELKTGVEYHIEETTIKHWPKSVSSSTRFPIFVSVELRLNEIPISKAYKSNDYFTNTQIPIKNSLIPTETKDGLNRLTGSRNTAKKVSR